MKKQFTILLILICALGLTTINFDNQSVQASSGMIAHWDFDEGSGSTLNDTVGGMDGAITGAVWTAGFRGNALSFDGIDDYVLTENVPILNAYTISFVVKSGGSDPVADLYPRIINTPAHRADMALVNGDKVYYNINGDAFHDSLCTASLDAWSFITMTYDGSSRKFYQNGVLRHTNNVSGADLVGPNSQSGGLSFGRNSSYGENDSYAKIYLDDVKLYDKVLSDSEILTEYENKECTQDMWGCGEWGECQSNGQQTRSCAITKECSFVDTLSPATTQSCTYIPPVCTSWTYSIWGTCSTGGQQTRNVLSSSPDGCAGGTSALTQACTYKPKPTINTNKFTPNYHFYLDSYKQDPDGGFSITGSNFGVQAGKIINLDDNNVELITKDWGDGAIVIYTKENVGKLILGSNRFILKTNDSIESDPFTITFEKYWIGPNVFSISPSKIHLGDQVEIIGENFGNNQPSNCPPFPSNTSFTQVVCGVLDWNNRPQKIVSWSDTKIVALIDNTDIALYPGYTRSIRVAPYDIRYVSNDGGDREGIKGKIEVLPPSCTVMYCRYMGLCRLEYLFGRWDSIANLYKNF